MASTRFIAVTTSNPDHIPAYLYRTASVLVTLTMAAPRHTHGMIVVVTSESDDAPALTQYQADRIRSGMHGATIHESVPAAFDALTYYLIPSRYYVSR